MNKILANIVSQIFVTIVWVTLAIMCSRLFLNNLSGNNICDSMYMPNNNLLNVIHSIFFYCWI